MKTIIAITVLMLISTILCGQVAYYPDYEKVEYDCAFCGKSLFEWREASSIYDGYFDVSCHYWKSDERGRTFEYNKKIHLCDECHEQYADSLKKSMKETWGSFIEKAKEEQSEKRIVEKEKQRQEELNEVENKIRALEEKKKLLE